MTNIFEYRKALKEEMQKTQVSDAEQLFLSNIGHIEKIANTKGYQMIRNYWIAEWNRALSLLNTIDINDLGNLSKIKAKLELATSFITYLDAHEKGLS